MTKPIEGILAPKPEVRPRGAIDSGNRPIPVRKANILWAIPGISTRT